VQNLKSHFIVLSLCVWCKVAQHMKLHTTYGFLLRQFRDLSWGRIWLNVFIDAFSFLLFLHFAAFASVTLLFQTVVSVGYFVCISSTLMYSAPVIKIVFEYAKQIFFKRVLLIHVVLHFSYKNGVLTNHSFTKHFLVSCGSWYTRNLHNQKQLDVDSSVNLIIIRFSTQFW